MLTVAVVGYGYWGSKHVRVLSAMPEVAVTVVDHDQLRLAEAQRAFPMVRLAGSLEDVLGTIDAVIIATPPRTHALLGLAALSADCHVLVEKPLATSAVECEKLINEAREANKVLMVGHTFLHNAAVWKLRQLIDERQLGELRYVDTARLNLGLYQSDVNVIWDLAPHDISIVNFLLGGVPDAVDTWGHSHANGVVEDVAYLQLRYSNPDVIAHIHVSWLDPCKVRRVTVVGTEKMAVYNDMSQTERVRVYDIGITADENEGSLHGVPMSYRYGDIVSPYVHFEEPLAVQAKHFVHCMQTGERPRTDGAGGLAVVRVLEAAERALHCGNDVSTGDLSVPG